MGVTLAKFDVSEIDRQGITDRHKIVIADCVLAWATFDSQFRAMLTAIEDRPLDLGALEYSRLKTGQAWQKLRKRLKDRGATEAVLEVVKSLEVSYKIHIDARNIISHAGCVGVWKVDSEYLVFAPFEALTPGEMVIIRQPLEVVERSTRWARAFSVLADKILRDLGY